MPTISKTTRINKELKRLQEKFTLADANQQDVIGPLLQNAAFMAITLEDLQAIINRDGPVDVYQNGANQYGTKPSAAAQTYNNLAKTYAGIIKTLSGLLPPEKKPAPPAPPKPTPEELAAEAAAHHEAVNSALAEAIEYQRQMKERKDAGEPWLSIQQWRAMQEDHAEILDTEDPEEAASIAE